MSKDLARLEASSGAPLTLPFHHLTARSVFIEGQVGVGFDEEVHASLLGHDVEARVAFVCSEPAGVVLTFQPSFELAAAIRAFRGHPAEDWDDMDVTGTHDAGEALLMGQLLARVEEEGTVDIDPEDPTNPGGRAFADLEDEVTPPAMKVDELVRVVEEDSGLQEGLQQSAGAPTASRSARLRATTQISGPDDEPD